MGRILGIDYGQVRIGLALSDERKIFASPYQTLAAGKTGKETAELIFRAVAPKGPIERIILGLPLMMSGKESPMSIKVREFALELETVFGIPLTLWDERLTSAMVEKEMRGAQVKRKKRAEVVDQLAAAAILQNYLDSPRIS